MAKYEPLDPVRYVDTAENIIKSYERPKFDLPSSSQIRNMASRITAIYDEVLLLPDDHLPEKITTKIAYLRVQIVYAGERDKNLKNFIQKTQLLDHIKHICDHPSRDQYILFTRYMEALIAYHAFYGGK